jgi:hypothetical protein
MHLKLYRGEPCGSGGYPEEVLSPEEDFFDMPMNIALSTDKKSMLLMDSVDYYQLTKLNKEQALTLADQFRRLAELMET